MGNSPFVSSYFQWGMIVVYLVMYLAVPALGVWGFVKFYRVMKGINDNLSGIRETLATREQRD